MGLIAFSNINDGTTIDASDVNTPFNTIYNDYNGGISSANLAASSVGTTQLIDANVTSAKVAAGFPVQIVNATFSAVATGTTVIPSDDTIPQITEGDEYMTLAIVPKSATNILVISANVLLSNSVTAALVVALFQDATANAIAVAGSFDSTATAMMSIPLTYTMVAGTTSSTTFRIRAGGNAAGTTTFNGQAAARRFGAITKSSIVITEYKV